MAQAAKIELSKVEEPIKAPITKFGGQPCWLEAPQWPVSRSLGKPMDFICQIALADVPGLPSGLSENGRVAYLFITSDLEGDVVPSWEPEGGENAVIIQPGGRMIVATVDQAVNPPFHAFPECAVRLTRQEEADFTEPGGERLGTVLCGGGPYPEIDEATSELLSVDKLGGVPYFLQYFEYPPNGGPWLPLLQFAGSDELVSPNFGTGKGYAFISEDGLEGRLLSQC